MNEMHYTPVHPGEVLKDENEELRLTQSAEEMRHSYGNGNQARQNPPWILSMTG